MTESSAAEVAANGRKAASKLQVLTVQERDEALQAIYDELRASKEAILVANREDMALAEEKARSGTLSKSLVKRLDLSAGSKFDDMLQGVLDVKALSDPLGRVTLRTLLDDGLVLERVSCPIGVLLVIFEARPEVIINITALALKSGNAAILKGGSESLRSLRALNDVVTRALAKTSAVPSHAVQLVSTRQEVGNLLSQDNNIDLVIPRGGNELVRSIKANTKIPVLGHADGLCSIYLHSDADADLAKRICLESKTDYCAGCNAVETILVNKDLGSTVFPAVAKTLLDAGVELRCDPRAYDALYSALGERKGVVKASEKDFDTEFLEFIVAVKLVDSVGDAVAHINEHGSRHTDCIVSESNEVASAFMRGVDSAGVYHNCSTRFADGFRYGFGAEVGISTNKIHSRGPVGLEGLTIYKYMLTGHGHLARDYGPGKKHYLHRQLPLQ